MKASKIAVAKGLSLSHQLMKILAYLDNNAGLGLVNTGSKGLI